MRYEQTLGDLILEGDTIDDGPVKGKVVERKPLDVDDPSHVGLILDTDDSQRVCVYLERETDYRVARRTEPRGEE